MKSRTDTKKEKPQVFIRTRATPALKERLHRYAKTIDRNPAWVLRAAVTEFLDNAENQKAA